VCGIGSEVLYASETVENEPSGAVGEWMSEVLNTSDSSTVCFIFDVKFGKFGKRINVELTSNDVNNITHTVSLFDYDIRTRDTGTQETYGTFEYHLNNVDLTKYQVCCVIIYYVYLFIFYNILKALIDVLSSDVRFVKQEAQLPLRNRASSMHSLKLSYFISP